MQSEPWPLRSMVFGAVGGISALAVHLLTDQLQQTDPDYLSRVTVVVAIIVLSLAFVLVCRRTRLVSAVVFSVTVAAVAAGVAYWRLSIDWLHPFSFLALLTALFIVSPFYQTSLHRHWNDYRALHHHAWSNAVILPLSVLFVGLTFAVAFLLAELFSLVGIEVLKNWLRIDMITWMLAGSALGAAIGVLREYEVIIGSTQRLVQSVFTLLAAPLALGLGGFLLILPFTGLDPLWDGTSHTSATLFTCAAAALVFVNAVVREDDEHQSESVVMHAAARVLALALAPLAIITGVAIKLRVDQYGWTPDRLWAAVVCLLVVGYGFIYLLAALRRTTFNRTVRQGNIILAVLVSAVALVLSTPWLDFGAYSANDQLARFKNGVIPEEQLDLTAMAFDFGPAGREALTELKAASADPLAGRIAQVLQAESRYAVNQIEENTASSLAQIQVLQGADEIPESLLATLAGDRACKQGYCYLLRGDRSRDVVLVEQNCHGTAGKICQPEIRYYQFRNGRWADLYRPTFNWFALFESLDADTRPERLQLLLQSLDEAAQAGKLQLRPVQRMQLFIDDVAVGPAIK